MRWWQIKRRDSDLERELQEQGSVPLGASGRPLQVNVLWSTPGIFSVLQVQPELGRCCRRQSAGHGITVGGLSLCQSSIFLGNQSST
jgi:hypothetical protein